MGYFKANYYSDFLEHREKYGTADSVSSERGSDGKKNNTSEYNHEYYMKNKSKWGVRQSYKKDDKDFDDENYTEANRIDGTDFHIKKKSDGSYVLLLEDEKWLIPSDADISSLKEQLKSIIRSNEKGKAPSIEDYEKVIDKFKTDEKEFDVDAAAMDVIRGKYKNGAERKAALGEDYAVVQKRVNELMATGAGKEAKEEASEEEKEKEKEKSRWDEIRDDYLINGKNVKHYEDLSSILLKDIL